MLPSYAECVTCVVWQLDLKNTSVYQKCGKSPHFGFPTLASLLYKGLLKATSKGQAHIFPLPISGSESCGVFSMIL